MTKQTMKHKCDKYEGQKVDIYQHQVYEFGNSQIMSSDSEWNRK